MKTYLIEIVKHNGKKTFTISGFVLSAELNKIKEKIGDVNKYRVGQKFTVAI